jgi:site-specific DNA-methyltransferase (adenine-specific)
MRMFLQHGPELVKYWNLSQDVVWKKHTGSNFAADRFRRVHEYALHWYRGGWNLIHHEVPKVTHTGRNQGTTPRTASGGSHLGQSGTGRVWTDDGTRYMQSVIEAKSLRGTALHPTEKPVGLLDPLIRYACPPGGLVLDPFAGSGSTAVAALMAGRRAVLIEAEERYCEAIATRLAQGLLGIEEVSR